MWHYEQYLRLHSSNAVQKVSGAESQGHGDHVGDHLKF